MFHKDWAKIVDFLLGHSDFKIAFLIKLRLYFDRVLRRKIRLRRRATTLVEASPQKLIGFLSAVVAFTLWLS